MVEQLIDVTIRDDVVLKSEQVSYGEIFLIFLYC